MLIQVVFVMFLILQTERLALASCSLVENSVNCDQSVQLNYFTRDIIKRNVESIYFIDPDSVRCNILNLRILPKLNNIWVTRNSGYCSCLCYDIALIGNNCDNVTAAVDDCLETTTNPTTTTGTTAAPPAADQPPTPLGNASLLCKKVTYSSAVPI